MQAFCANFKKAVGGWSFKAVLFLKSELPYVLRRSLEQNSSLIRINLNTQFRFKLGRNLILIQS